MDDDLDQRIPSDVEPDRRTFVKRVVATAAFAAPFVASFDLQDMRSSVASAATVSYGNP
jgi:hypothetical protein